MVFGAESLKANVNSLRNTAIGLLVVGAILFIVWLALPEEDQTWMIWVPSLLCGLAAVVAGGFWWKASNVVVAVEEISDGAQTATALAAHAQTAAVLAAHAQTAATLADGAELDANPVSSSAPADGAELLDGISSMSTAPAFTESTTDLTTGSTAEESIGQVSDGLPVPEIPQ